MPETQIPELQQSVPGASLPSQLLCWSFFQRVAFRFGFSYLVLYCLPGSGRISLLATLPVGAERLTDWAEAPWRALCPWVAIHVFRLTGPVTRYHPTGSGDTSLDYIQVFCFAVIAIVATAVWSILDRRRPHYRSLYAWLRLGVRFTLAFTLLGYGFAKVFPLQFIPPRLFTLTEMYGEASPMNLLWTFMGASTAYTIFGGLAEVTPGILLLFRRTTTLGALAAAAVMLNIVMLNFCYDVPVKLYSLHILLMSLFLLLPDAKRLWNFFVLHRTARLEGVWLPKFERRWLRVGAIVLQILVIVSVLYSNIWDGYKALQQRDAQVKRPSLYGVWDVDSFSRDGSVSSSIPEASQWRRVVIESPGYLVVRTNGGDAISFQTTYQEPKHNLKLTGRRTKQVGEFTYSQPDDQHIVLLGNLDNNPVAARFHRYKTTQFLLTSRGFHWINEDPFNR